MMKVNIKPEPDEYETCSNVYVFPSQTDANRYHFTFLDSVGEAHCSCIAGSMGMNCWHIDKVKEITGA